MTQNALRILSAGIIAGACTPSMPIPSSLEPAGSSLAMIVPAKGTQIYECRRKGDGFEWAFVAPDAALYDARGNQIGIHGAGPFWQSVDGSRVTGKVAAKADAPAGHAIPWLLLSTTSSGPSGSFSGVTYIQRVNTIGGTAPVKPCMGEMVGQQTGVHYTAEYRFFVANAK